MESSIYQRARREWDERYADLVLGKRNWQIAAAGSIAVSLILASGVVVVSCRRVIERGRAPTSCFGPAFDPVPRASRPVHAHSVKFDDFALVSHDSAST